MKDFIANDCEVYPNYFLAAFKRLSDGKMLHFEAKGRDGKLSEKQRKKLYSIMAKYWTFGFNSRNYDLPIIMHALQGSTCESICKMSNYIIENNKPGWMTLQEYGYNVGWCKHFDISEPAPGVRVSLKSYGANIHSKKLQDLPIQPNTDLTEQEMIDTKLYCGNDLDTTIDLFNKIKSRIMLRFDMAKKYGDDVLSKSDAQIAEVAIAHDIEKITGSKVYKPKAKIEKVRYSSPDYIKFQSKELNELLDFVNKHEFEITGSGSVKLPKELSSRKFKIGNSAYKVGIGGLHSTEKSQVVVPQKDQLLIDKDVASYYPAIILNLGLKPPHLGDAFLKVYKGIVDERLEAKREGNKVVDESLKILINGSFGKFGNKYSKLYAPDLLITVTLTGQLALLMLIEQLESKGISVVSANTDGFVSLLDKNLEGMYEMICYEWELTTGFELESLEYNGLYSRDVNNYLAHLREPEINKDGEEKWYKPKGIFVTNTINKGPAGNIAVQAVIDNIVHGADIEKTIRDCKDVTQFVFARKVTGGAVWNGEFLGRVVRFIYSTKGQPITYKKNGYLVPKSEGSRPIMDLEDLPSDIDYDRYMLEANNIMESLGL